MERSELPDGPLIASENQGVRWLLLSEERRAWLFSVIKMVVLAFGALVPIVAGSLTIWKQLAN